MNPKLKEKELDELLADEAAQLEAEAQQEIPYVVTYRDNADLSTKLDIPKDVKGLVKLVEEKKELLGKINNLQNEKYILSGSDFRGMVWAIPGIFLAVSAPFNMSNSILQYFAGLGLATGGMIYGLVKAEKAGKKTFKQTKVIEIQKFQEQIKPLDRKLSHYQKDYHLSDIVLVDDLELGYSLGDIVYSHNKVVLHQTYHRLIRNVSGAMDNRYWSLCKESKPIDENSIISVLKRSTEKLSIDDLRYLEEGTPLLCVSAKFLIGDPANRVIEYGFFENKKSEDIFLLRTLRKFQGPGEYWCKFDQVDRGKIEAYLLVPEIKPRI